MLCWVGWGYSLAFTDGSSVIGGLSKLFLSGVMPDSRVATFTDGVEIPESVFVCFQITFAAITPAAGKAGPFGTILLKVTMSLRVSDEVERGGLDLGEHGERAYNH